jgi:superoxide dismutase
MRDIITLLEEKSRSSDIEIIALNFDPKDVSPVITSRPFDIHYNQLAKGYAERYNNKEGDRDFNYAGAFLHNMLFTQLRKVRENNSPNGPIKGFIDKHYGNFTDFKDEFQEVALTIQGSGWAYLALDGKIKTIKNHEVRDDILVIVDRWEHAYFIDYGNDKKKYLKEQWKIINWNVISTRLAKYW